MLRQTRIIGKLCSQSQKEMSKQNVLISQSIPLAGFGGCDFCIFGRCKFCKRCCWDIKNCLLCKNDNN